MIEEEPTANAVVVHVAAPLDKDTTPLELLVHAKGAAESPFKATIKATLPPGVPLPGEAAATVALNVTDAPNTVDPLPDCSATVTVVESGMVYIKKSRIKCH